VPGDEGLTFYRSPLLSDLSAPVTLFVVGRWLYCVHKVQDYPNVGFSHAVAYHYKTNMMDTQTLEEVRYQAMNSSSEKLHGFPTFCHLITFTRFVSGS
jgi:hypothetical protein